MTIGDVNLTKKKKSIDIPVKNTCWTSHILASRNLTAWNYSMTHYTTSFDNMHDTLLLKTLDVRRHTRMEKKKDFWAKNGFLLVNFFSKFCSDWIRSDYSLAPAFFPL